MSWWQTKLTSYALRYFITKSGFLDEQSIDPGVYGKIGLNSEIELKNVGLNVEALKKFAELPPGLRIETARVLLLRARIPTDLWQSSIDLQVDGVEITARLQEVPESSPKDKRKSRPRSPVSVRSPEHRKVQRRIHSPPPLDEDDDELHIPTTQEMAMSFLQHEPAEERKEIEAALATDDKGMEESIMSESSQSSVGVGTGTSLPGFLSGFIQGLQDRLKANIKNVEIKLETEARGDAGDSLPVTIRLRVPHAELQPLTPAKAGDTPTEKRQVELSDITLDLLTDAVVFSELSEVSSRPSHAASKRASRSSDHSKPSLDSPILQASTTSTASSGHRLVEDDLATSPVRPSTGASITEVTAGDAPDPLQSTIFQSTYPANTGLDIQPGDDNISWGSRRSQAATPAPEDLWNSMTSEDDLPDSLLLARVSTPLANMSRSTSPTAVRTRRAMSPYDRKLQGPGSWPRPMTPEQHRAQPSPGSWPTVDQSQHGMCQPLTPGPTVQHQEDYMDNKQHALEASTLSSGSQSPEDQYHNAESPPEPTPDQMEDLTQSKMYSHKDAESMYMSAMTHSPKMAIPGGWGHDVDESDRSEPPDVQPHDIDGANESRHASAQEQQPASGNVTPRAQSPEGQRKPGLELAAKRLLTIDQIVLGLPTEKVEQDAEAHSPSANKQYARERRRSQGQGLPGAFSTYSELAASRRQGSSSARTGERSVLWTPEPVATEADPCQTLHIGLGAVNVAADLACLQLLYKTSSLAANVLSAGNAVSSKKEPARRVEAPSKGMLVSGSVQQLRVALFEQLQYTHERSAETELAALHFQGLSISTDNGNTDFRTGRLKAFFSGSELLTFDREGVMKTSVILTEHTPDIAATVCTSRATIQGRPITDITVETLPIKLELDMKAFEDTLSSFGGLSGLLELSNSMLSEGSPMSSPVPSSKPIKGVRFQGDPVAPPKGSEVKFNGNFGGVDVTLRGDACAVSLRTTKIKTVYREGGSSATVAHVILSGPYVDQSEIEPLNIDIANIKFDFLNAPTEKDVERLISLVSPSKDKYDSDDVMIDTLTRQRHKGSLARIGVGDLKAKVPQWECVEPLTALAGELGKLSAVTKYLPDDDRPGLLTLARVKAFEAQMPVNDRFGKMQIVGQDLHCAHVGAPPLLALSLGTIHIDREGHAVLLHPLTSSNGNGDALPMLMIRNLGEAEPVVKIKVFNTLVEYSVPTILALTNMDLRKDVEEIVVDLAQSVANLTIPDVHKASRTAPQQKPSASEKRTKLDVLIHDSAIGLQPEKLPAKGMLVLSDARFSMMLPPENKMTASLELRRSALFATDDAAAAAGEASSSRRTRSNASTDARLAAALSQDGFVSLGSIRSMKMAAHIEDTEGRNKTVQVDVSSELLLLETCADSTQTLFAILGGLAPPTPPSTEPKYRTQAMTIEDMMASFTGEPEKEAEPPLGPETLFDAEEDPGSEPPLSMQASAVIDDNDDLLLASGMSASLYGPVSGMLGGVDRPVDDDGQSGDLDETAESLLEEDPFEMTMAPGDMAMGDAALIRDLNKQGKSATKMESVDLESYEIEDLGFDALGTGQQALGTQHRFARPTIKGNRLPDPGAQKKLPFCLRLRDTNVLWHLHDGYDWRKTRDGITHGFEQMEQRHEERLARRCVSAEAREDKEDVIGDMLFNSIYIQIPLNQDPQDLRRQLNRAIDDTASETESQPVSNLSRPTQYSASGRPIRQTPKRRLKIERSRTHKVSIELHNLCADVLVFPPGEGDVNSSVDVRVKDFEIYDNLSTSTWKKFLTSLGQGVKDREMAKPMVHLEVLNVKTLQEYSASEIIIHASLLPLRLHVDQDCLDFIVRFFSFKDTTDATPPKTPDEQPFLQRLEVDTVDIRLDYKPKRVDYALLRSGKTGELINFAALEYAPIRLKHTIVYGLRGFEPIHQTLNDIWMPDVTRRQLPKIVAGVAAVRHLSNLGAGFKDVVAIPVREYRKDGRLVRSIQKGAFQFGKTTASELARLGAKIAIGTGNILQGTEGMLAPSSSSGRPGTVRTISNEWQDLENDDEDHEPRAISSYANQPLGIFSGLRAARQNLERDLLTAKDAFIAVQGEVLESSSPGAAAAAVGRYAPIVLLRPVIGATRAVGDTLLGFGNAVDREGVRRMEDKYKKT